MKNRYTIFLLLGMVFLIFACEKQTIDNSDNGNYPLQLDITLDNKLPTLTWTEANISTFVEYVIVRSQEPIADDPDVIGSEATVIQRIDDMEMTTFTDLMVPLAEELYYKVFVNLDSRFIFTNTEHFDLDLTILEFSFLNAEISEAQKSIYFLNQNSFALDRYNYETGEMGESVTTFDLFSQRIWMEETTLGEELFMTNQNGPQMLIFDPVDLSLKKTVNTIGDVWSAAGDEGLLFLATESFSNSVSVLDRSSGNFLQGHNFSSYFEFRTLMTIPGTSREIIEVSDERVDYYRFSANGTLQAHDSESFSFRTLVQSPSISPDGNYFIGHFDGTIFRKNLNQLGKLQTQANTFFSDFAFSKESDKVYAVGNFQQQIDVFSVPELEFLETLSFPFIVHKVFVTDEKLIVLGRGVLGFQEVTIVELLDL